MIKTFEVQITGGDIAIVVATTYSFVDGLLVFKDKDREVVAIFRNWDYLSVKKEGPEET